MRIVTRPDFDGVVCAVLLYEVETIDQPIKWVQPDDIQNAQIKIDTEDILANLPYDNRCGLWFDHHYSNKTVRNFQGNFKLAPSAARVIYEYYQDRFNRDFSELVRKADKIDSADLSVDDVLYPENDPYFLLSLTVSHANYDKPDDAYFNRLVSLLREMDIRRVLEDAEVKKQCNENIEQKSAFKELLKSHATVKDHVSIVDFRPVYPVPKGNRFLVYTIFPETVVSIEIGYKDERKENVRLKVGHNIFNPNCHVNIGLMLSRFGGGGHRGAGGCSFQAEKADSYISKIIDILVENRPNED
jgi:oligoribonuclease NrnB/cAMP/cGMP phosphodiesterase (DHH superfamily)